MIRWLLLPIVVLCAACSSVHADNPVVVIDTSMGTIKVELFQDKSPITVKNFMGYVDDKFYDDMIFHRVIKDFMIQGGGMAKGGAKEEKKTKDPIKNEAVDNKLSNDAYTIAMARTNKPDSATSQFFINTKDNTKKLDPNPRNPAGYCVFGKVIEGKDVVDKIAAVKVKDNGHDEESKPVEEVIIKSIRKVEKK